MHHGRSSVAAAAAINVAAYTTKESVASCTHSVGAGINAISPSPDGSSFAVVGREVLKIFNLCDVDGSLRIEQQKNLRVGRTNLTFSSVDVQWNPHHERSHLIATAATNKNVIVWNLHLPQKSQQEYVMKEHMRTVNSLCWSPTAVDVFLSGSQDGTVKMWDLREGTTSVATFPTRSQSVREVRFSPHYRNYFAAAYDDGSVQIWDVRNPARGAMQQLSSAHNGLVLALDWHPSDRNVLASGGRDRFIKMWNLKHSGNPVHSCQTPGAVGRIKWRPGSGAMMAASFSTVNSSVHVWDLQHPNIPAYGLDKGGDVATGIVWLQDTPSHLLLASKDGSMGVYRVPEDAYLNYHHVRTAGLTWNTEEELVVLNDVIDRAKYDSSSGPSEEMKLASKGTSFSMLFSPATPSPPPPPPPSARKRELTLSHGLLHTHDISFHSPQICAVAPDPVTFRFLAEKYRFNMAGEDERTFEELCGWNRKVALAARREHAAQFWGLIRFFFTSSEKRVQASGDDELEEKTTEDLESKSNATLETIETMENSTEYSSHRKVESSGFGSECAFEEGRDDVSELLQYREQENELAFPFANTYMGSFGRDQSSFLAGEAYMALVPLPEEAESAVLEGDAQDAFAVEKEGASATPLTQLLDKVNATAPALDPAEAILRALHFHAEHGDVQTCVIVSLVLGSRLEITQTWRAFWEQSYIDLLQRHQLWVEANAIVKASSVAAIRSISQKSTVVHISCPHCKKPLQGPSHACANCSKRISRCSLCHKVVRGIYVWCQGCGHGGHLRHMKEWFSSNTVCPAGCNHRCTFTW